MMSGGEVRKRSGAAAGTKSSGGSDEAGREAMSSPLVRGGALVCLAARMAEGGREGKVPILQTWQIVLP